MSYTLKFPTYKVIVTKSSTQPYIGIIKNIKTLHNINTTVLYLQSINMKLNFGSFRGKLRDMVALLIIHL